MSEQWLNVFVLRCLSVFLGLDGKLFLPYDNIHEEVTVEIRELSLGMSLYVRLSVMHCCLESPIVNGIPGYILKLIQVKPILSRH